MSEPIPGPTGTVPQFGGPLPLQTTEIEAGLRVDDFDILAKIGEGGFAKVFLARQRSMQRIVALKVSRDQGTEPQTLAQLDHPHIVRVYDQRVLADCGLRLLYMPYLAGGTLKDVVPRVKSTPDHQRTGMLLLDAVNATLDSRGEVIPTDGATRTMMANMTWPEAVCWIGARMADALAYAHRIGVQHRDIKPANVLLGADAVPRLADFNVSACESVAPGSTAGLGGSFAYMAPEQLQAFTSSESPAMVPVDGRADIFSLGVTLWELLTGSRPFAGTEPDTDIPTITAMVARRSSGITPKLETHLPSDLLPGLKDVLKTCLAANPQDRFRNAEELARALDLCRKPAARALLNPAPGWRTWIARHPLFTLIFIGLFVNGLAALFSIKYNGAAIVHPYPALADTFELLQLIINGTFFPVCTVLFAAVILPVVKGLKRVQSESLTNPELTTLRRQTLRLGPLSVQVCLWAWVAAGVLFPVAMHYRVHELPSSFFAHFLASQTLCGLIAVTYPQFAVSFVSLRCFYPRFVSQSGLTQEDLQQVRRLERTQGVFLILAASIPMLAVGLLVIFGRENRLALGVMSVVGLVGFLLAYLFTGAIRADRAALESLQ